MKQEKKMQKNLFRKENGNKGFSLVELIIVMAIMAILTGIVGTQVVPYINKAKEAKDLQIVDSISTAAVSAYTMYTEALKDLPKNTGIVIYKNTKTDPAEKKFVEEIQNFSGITDIQKAGWSSDKGTKIKDVTVTIDTANGKLIVQAVDASGAAVLDKVESIIGGATP